MEMQTVDCPVCGRRGALAGTDPHNRDDVKFQCELSACRFFVMDGRFLQDNWLTVPLEDKADIAVYLQSREEPEDPKDRKPPRISKENYHYYVRAGKRYQRRAREEQKEGEQADPSVDDAA